jgi:hypothetical protein
LQAAEGNIFLPPLLFAFITEINPYKYLFLKDLSILWPRHQFGMAFANLRVLGFARSD